MSNTASDKSQVTPAAAIKRLERAVERAVDEVERLRGELARLEAQCEELNGLIRGVASGERSPREMVERSNLLEEENRDLRARVNQAREGVDRLLAKVRFLEEQR